LSSVRAGLHGVLDARGGKSREAQRQGLLDGLRLQHSSGTTADAHPAAFHLAANPVSAPWNETSPLGMPVLLGVYN